MTLGGDFTKKIEMYKRMSELGNAQALQKFQSLTMVWKTVLIFFKLNYIDKMLLCGSWLYIVVGKKNSLCWSVSKGQSVMTAYLVVVLL